MVGTSVPYPAFDSVLSILNQNLGNKNVFKLQYRNWVNKMPALLRPLVFFLQDILLCINLILYCKKNCANSVLFFQCYFPFTCAILKLHNIKLLIYVGGSDFLWSYINNVSLIGRIFVYINLNNALLCHRLADIIITLSKSMIEFISVKYADKTYFALPRIDNNFWKDFRIIKNYNSRQNIVGYLGILNKRKGICNLIKAMRIIKDKKIDCRLVVVGGGPLLEYIKSKVVNFGLEKTVDLRGRIDYSELAKYYNEMKLFILPSYAEGIPSTIFEAMACGTPVLATSVGGIPDIVVDGQTGFVIKSVDPQFIANQIICLLQSPDLLERISNNTYIWLTEYCNNHCIRDSWKNILVQLEFLITRR